MKKLVWATLVVAFIIYAIVVYGWWQEGNRNERMYEQNTIFRH